LEFSRRIRIFWPERDVGSIKREIKKTPHRFLYPQGEDGVAGEEKNMDHKLIQQAAKDILQSKRRSLLPAQGFLSRVGFQTSGVLEGFGRNSILRNMPTSMPSSRTRKKSG